MIGTTRLAGRASLAVLFGGLCLLPTATHHVAPVPGVPVDRQTTAAITRPDVTPPRPELDEGLAALAGGSLDAARAAHDALPPASLERRILAWAIAMRGSAEIGSAEIAAAMAELPGWPGQATLRARFERALAREKPDAATVLAAFSRQAPQTVSGKLLMVRALVASGQIDPARSLLSPVWRAERLEAAEEARILTEFSALLTPADHRARMERMLYLDRIASAQRVAALAGAQPLADAWAAVIRNDKASAKLIEAVPAELRGPGYAFIKARQLRRQGDYAEAAKLVLAAPTDRASLIDPDAWWVERRALSREMLDLGDAKAAYRIAAGHSAESQVNVADAEFHAGWYALRALDDAKTAFPHFARLAEVSDGPISLSRAYYWMGRAAEAGGADGADIYFRVAAGYGTTFYGQLAAERIGGTTLALALPEPTAPDRAAFESSDAVRAIRRLEAAGQQDLADMITRDLAAEIGSPGQLALLAGMAEARGDHFLALKVGKIAAAAGRDIGALTHPVGAIPASADIAGAGMALAYAIARQESEFNVGAVSRAGARGLLQLLPTTAQEVAKKAGLPFSAARLTSDPAYNATLGAAFLGEQLGRFDGSYVLTFAGYNAGPRRAREWVVRYGDPRGKDIDTVVDWIERIPYAETRTYVQRVMENYQVYKMRLSGSFDIVGDLCKGRG